MVRLDRSKVVAPADWPRRVDGHFPDAREFRRKSRDYERKTLTARRKKGFADCAPSVLPKVGKKIGRTREPDFPAVWRSDKRVRKALKEMTGGHCAYCQSQVAAGGTGEVEHFKPKALFPTLAYEWDNYFFSCKLCNGPKKDRWPQCGYVRPDVGAPEGRFVFEADGTVNPRKRDRAAKATYDDMQLWRNDLVIAREIAVSGRMKTVAAALAIKKMSVAERRKLISTLLVPDLSPYSQAVNQCVRRAWEAAFPGVAL